VNQTLYKDGPSIRSGDFYSLGIGQVVTANPSPNTVAEKIYNPRDFLRLDNVDRLVNEWTPSESIYTMVIFDPVEGRYAYLNTIQYQENFKISGNTYSNKKVRWSDATKVAGATNGGSGNWLNGQNLQLDPIFLLNSEENLDWYQVTSLATGGAATGAMGSGVYLPWAVRDLDYIPEPATATLTLLGFAMLGLRRRVRHG